jgi:hypothetical protein
MRITHATHKRFSPNPKLPTPQILEVMLDDDIALCLTPQGFNNVDAQSGERGRGPPRRAGAVRCWRGL